MLVKCGLILIDLNIKFCLSEKFISCYFLVAQQ